MRTASSPERRAAAAALAVLLLAAPAAGQGRIPEALADQLGAQDCVALARAIGRAEVVIASFRGAGTTIGGGTFRFEGNVCFRSMAQCERFGGELRLDYADGEVAVSCRQGG